MKKILLHLSLMFSAFNYGILHADSLSVDNPDEEFEERTYYTYYAQNSKTLLKKHSDLCKQKYTDPAELILAAKQIAGYTYIGAVDIRNVMARKTSDSKWSMGKSNYCKDTTSRSISKWNNKLEKRADKILDLIKIKTKVDTTALTQ